MRSAHKSIKLLLLLPAVFFLVQVEATAQLRDIRRGRVFNDFGNVSAPSKPQHISIVVGHAWPMLDFRAMRRWELKEDDLPSGRDFLNRLPSFWLVYKWYIFASTLLFMTIVALLWQRNKRKKTETELSRFRSAMESGNTIGWEWDIANGCDFWFGDLGAVFGIPAGSFTSETRDFYRYIHPDDRKQVSEAMKQAQRSRSSYLGEFRVVQHDGTERWLASRGTFEYAENGDALRMTGMAVDITERKQKEAALKRSEDKFFRAFRESPMILTLTNLKDHRYVDVNKAYERTTGWSHDETVGRSSFDLGIWVDPAQRVVFIDRVLAEGTVRNFEVSFRTKAGEVRTGLVAGELIEINGEPCALTVTADITEVKRAEEARRASELRFSEFFETLPEYCYMTSLSGEILDANPAACKALGYKREELLGKPMSDIYAPESALRLVNLLEKWKRTRTLRNEEMVILTKEGRRRAVLLNAGSVKDAAGGLVHSASVQVDITERKKILEKLRESEERFRLVANAVPVMIWMAGPDKLCTYFNQPWLKFTGRPIQLEIGNGWMEHLHPEDSQACLDTYTNAFDRRESFGMEYRLRRHDGEYRWVFDLGVPRFNRDGSFAGYIGSCLDVTERRQTEEALSRVSRRLIEAHEEERTRIARELHDDINQRVALLAANLERLKRDLPASEVQANRGIEEARAYVSDLGSDIQALSHRLHSSKLEYVGLDAAASGFCRELSEQKGVEIAVHSQGIPKKLPQEISLCLFRVLQEALHNAVKHSGARQFEVSLAGSPNEIQLSVHDAGIGFDLEEALRSRGLGLASMKERLKLVAGKLSIDSRPNSGTTIQASVPLVASKSAKAGG